MSWPTAVFGAIVAISAASVVVKLLDVRRDITKPSEDEKKGWMD